METLKFLLIARFKRFSKASTKDRGFTLLELLVGLVLTFLIIAPLLGFVVNVMNTDRQEQAKVNSEQELQAAMEYISRDLQQAVYIYDSVALNNNHKTAPTASNPSGIKDQLPTVANGVPVLVFWKRKLVPKSLQPNTSTNCPLSPLNPDCNDAFVYALVGYYLIKDSTPTAPWSGTARIGRFEIHDAAVKDANGSPVYTDPNDPRSMSPGFATFNLSSSNVTSSMNQWKSSNPAAIPSPADNILVDYIDQSTNVGPQETNTGGTLNCPPRPSNAVAGDPGWLQVPDYTNNPDIPANLKTFSFYACVWSSQNTARVYLRGNALARIRNDIPTYIDQFSSYFPTAKTQIKSSAGLGSGS